MTDDLLLIEQWGQPMEVINSAEGLVTESGENLPPGLYIEGIFIQADVVNRNRRLYPKRIMEAAVGKYMKEQVSTKQALGELNHPPRANVDPMQAAIIIEDMWWKGSNVYGRARVIEGDNGPGDKLAANIRAGWKPGVSSRGLGKVEKSRSGGYDIVQEGYRLTVGVDVVWGPSAPDAWVNPRQISESSTDEPTVTKSNDNDKFKALTESLKAL